MGEQVQIWLWVPSKWHYSREQNVADHASCPDIQFGSITGDGDDMDVGKDT